MSTMFIIAQCFGVLALLSYIVSTQQKHREGILAWDGIYCTFLSIQYLLLGGLSGFVAGALQVTRDVIFRKFKKKIPTWATIVFCILVFISGIIFFDGPVSLLPGIHTIIHTLYLSYGDMTIYRFIRLFSLTFMFAYNIFMGAYVGIIIVLVQGVFSVIGLARLDGEKVKKVMHK